MSAETSSSPRPNGYQRFLCGLFLVAVVLMTTQYAFLKHGQGKVFITPLNFSQPDDFAHMPKDQRAGTYFINWGTLDKCAYKLQVNTYLAPSDMVLVPLTFVLALPLLFVLGWRQQVWPRAALVLLVLLAFLSCFGAESFKEAVKQNARIAEFLVCCWLAATIFAEPGALKRCGSWLAVAAVVLVVYGALEWVRYVLLAGPGAEQPLMVRATCQSRSAYSGLMVMLLSLCFGRVLAGRDFGDAVVFGVAGLVGAVTLTTAGGLLALGVALLAMAWQRGRFAFLVSALLVAVVGVGLVLAARQSPALPVPGFVQRQADVLARSWEFCRWDNGRPSAVEKRYLEWAATINGLRQTKDVTGPKQDESESLPVIGLRSNVLMGVGPGRNYQQSIGEYYLNLDNPEKQEPDTYCVYLILALQMGLFAALVWAWLLLDGAAVTKEAYQRLADDELRAVALGIYGACIGLVVFSVFGTILLRGTSLLLCVLLGVGYRLHRLAQPAPAPAPIKEKPVPVLTDEPEEEEPAAAPAEAPAAVAAPLPDREPESAPTPPAAPEAPPAPASEPDPGPAKSTGDLQSWLREQGLLEDDKPGDKPAE